MFIPKQNIKPWMDIYIYKTSEIANMDMYELFIRYPNTNTSNRVKNKNLGANDTFY